MFGYIYEYNDIYRYNLCQQKIKKEDRMNAKQAIENLRIMSATLENAANRPENYNTPYSQYLENISYEMFKHANQLQELDYLYGIAL